MSTQKINQPREKYVIPCIKKLLGVPNKLPNLEKIREKRKKKPHSPNPIFAMHWHVTSVHQEYNPLLHYYFFGRKNKCAPCSH